MPKFSYKSLERLNTCHPDLIRLFNEVVKEVDCSIICGYRGEKEQNIAYESGYSQLKFPESKHNVNPSLAVDILPYPTLYSDSRAIHYLAGFIDATAKRLGIKIIWGGRWKNFPDQPHWELI